MSTGNKSAFPIATGVNTSGQYALGGGLSKREYFAALAMQSLILARDQLVAGRVIAQPDNVGREAVEYADGVLEELERSEKKESRR